MMCFGVVLWMAAVVAPAWAQPPPFLTFDTGQVRPLAVSPDGTRLFAVNTPDNQLEIFTIDGTGALAPSGVVQVGMEPVAVAARTNTEVWVVNHLSDSVSIVDLSGAEPRVVRTLLVGDEPNDIVFAGPGGNRAFISTAHRGQNHPIPRGNFATPGERRADVFVFDATSLGSTLGGTPIAVISLFTDKPRALAVSPDGSKVYTAGFHTGNRTTPITEGLVCDTSAANMSSNGVQGSCVINSTTLPGGYPPPHRNQQSINRPETGLIVQFDRPGSPAGTWADELDRSWNAVVRFNLPDRDVFEIDATADPVPVAVNGSATCANGSGCWARVGTILFNMIVHPTNGKIYVSNTEAQNHVRFEGPGAIATGVKPVGEPTTVQGNLGQSQITVLDGASVNRRHLNKHINYSIRPAPAGTAANSLATPLGMAMSSDGNTLYVAAFGSAKIGIFNTAQLDNDTFTPSATNHIQLTGGGPSGLALRNNRLYVLTRFDNAVRVVDTGTRNELQILPLHNPEPDIVVDGRPFLYDAMLTSSNGEASCSSCHIFADMDDLPWDLGNPDDNQVTNINEFNPVVGTGGLPAVYHPMKGPMATQSLRGLEHMGAEHWRGDRQGDGNPGNAGNIDDILAFEAFNVAFEGLVGRATELTTAQMTAFREFVMEVRYPPNPIRQLNNALRADELAGFNMYNGPITDFVANCNGCHTLNPAQGFFGGDGQITFEGEPQHFKVPHLRNQYQKVGMFGMANPTTLGGSLGGSFAHQGNQIRGSGFLHDGSIDTLFRFHSAGLFDLDNTEQTQMEAFMVAFNSDLAPIVGQQITRTSGNGGVANPQVDLFVQRAEAAFSSKILGGSVTECEVIAKFNAQLPPGAEQRGALYVGGGNWVTDRDSEPLRTTTFMKNLAGSAGQEVTFTCVPPGSGIRMGLDRDLDGFFDTDEIDAGSDPADPSSVPGGSTTTTTTTTPVTTSTSSSSTTLPSSGPVRIQTTALRLVDDSTPPVDTSRRRVRFSSRSKFDPPANQIVVPAQNGSGDPTLFGGSVTVYNTNGGDDFITVFLSHTNWSRLGTGPSPSGWLYRSPDPDAPIRTVRVRASEITVRGGRQDWVYTLDEPSQERIGLRLLLGTSAEWCTEAGQPGFPPSADEVDRYTAQRRTPPPPSCPGLPGGGSPSGAFVDPATTLY
jgi:sugar lactone lactonase YvrE